jgi:hypothetical protein
MEQTKQGRSCAIRKLNDDLRTGGSGGQVFITRGVQAIGEACVSAAINALRTFDEFTPDNDPNGEHDFGRIVIEGEPLFWKIDYYDENREFGSIDPSDPERTTRVLTLMLAGEY